MGVSWLRGLLGNRHRVSTPNAIASRNRATIAFQFRIARGGGFAGRCIRGFGGLFGFAGLITCSPREDRRFEEVIDFRTF